MILIDNALAAREAEGKPIRVGLIGSGFMAQGLTNQIENSVPGMTVVAIFNRDPARAEKVFQYAGHPRVHFARGSADCDAKIRSRTPVVSDDPYLICNSPEVDVVVELTGSVVFGAEVTMAALEAKKHVVLMNAELDATVGPILQVYADQLGGTLSACEGDEPGVQMNLYRWVKGLGLIPRVMGNVKGLQDPYRTPTTQLEWATKWGQNPVMVTSFADGSKISFEQAIVANATGFKVRGRGMSRGKKFDGPVSELPSLYDLEEVREQGGVVDYTVGPPGVKVFCLAEHQDPKQQKYLELYKMGPGPLYPFTVPYHLVHFEVPNAVARVVLFGDNVAKPIRGPVVEVCAVAKRDLREGEVLDGPGGFMTYGEAVNSDEMSELQLMPEGLVEGCTVLREVEKDEVLRYEDLKAPLGRLADRLRAEQCERFLGETWLRDLPYG